MQVFFALEKKEKRNSFILCCTGKNFYTVAQQNSDLGGNALLWDGTHYYIQRGADSATKKQLDGLETVFPKILIQPNAGQGNTDTFTIDVSEKEVISIESMQSWYDNASVSIVADDTVNLFAKSHQTGGSNRIDTSEIGILNVSAYKTITITFSAVATNSGARGWATLNNIVIA